MRSAGKWFLVVATVVFVSALLLSRLHELSKLNRLSERIQFTDGKHQKHYPDGTLQGEWSYKDDRLHGESIEYYANGKLKYEDCWVKGNLVWRRTYGTNGVLVRTFGEKPAASVN